MKPLIVANWKMNPQTLAEAKGLFNAIKNSMSRANDVEVVICPPFIYISTFQQSNDSIIKLGAQDCFWEQKGAFTGEVSPKMLKNSGVEYVIIGHSERRRYLQETDEMINKKIRAALKIGLSPIFCVGDKNRSSKEDIKEVGQQLKKGLYGLKKLNLSKLIITYEPVWAISTASGASAATPKDAKEGLFYIKNTLYKLLSKSSALKIRIIYGGSVNAGNARDFINIAGFQGLLVGEASLNKKQFVKIIENTI